MEDNFRLLDIDRKDLEILGILQREGRISNAELAERVALSPSPCWKRLKRLESLGIISGYKAVLDRDRLGLGMTVFVSVLLSDHTERTCQEFESRILEFPEVVAFHNISGQHDYLLQVLTRDMESYSTFALRKLRGVPHVKEIHSTFSLREIRSTTDIPL